MAVVSRSLGVGLVALMMAAGCGDKDDLEGIGESDPSAPPGQPSGGPRPGTEPDGRTDAGIAGTQLDPRPDAGAGGPSLQPPSGPSGTVGTPLAAAACDLPLGPASTGLCSGSDRYEEVTGAVPPRIDIGSTCAELQTLITQRDSDRYTFVTQKSDPVAVDLSYTGVGEADLGVSLFAPNGDRVATRDDSRTTAVEHSRFEAAVTAGGSYTVAVDSYRATCQPYALRVDSRFCTDALEDNDVSESATKVAWNAQQRAEYDVSVHYLDHDWYQLTSTKADPVLLRLSYSAGPDNIADLGYAVYGSNGNRFASEDGNRQGATESLSTWLAAPEPNSLYRVDVSAYRGLCTPYKISFDAAACTDPFEDNDSDRTATPLQPNQEIQANVIRSDVDVYDVSALSAGGTCVITYTLDSAAPQELSAQVRSRTSARITDAGPSGSAASKTFEVKWKADADARYVEVHADKWTCQPYTIRCSGS